MNKENVVHARTRAHTRTHNGIVFSLKKENIAICDYIELRSLYAKLNKPVTEGQLVHDFTYEVSKIVKLIEAENTKVVAHSWG